MTAVATTQAILDALNPKQTPSQWESAFVRAGSDWDDLVVRAIVLGLAPQLHVRLSQWPVKLSSSAAAKLAVTYRAQAQRNEAIYAQLAEVLAACQDHGLQPIALKGAHLAACYYAEPALRPMNDIDLLFTLAELPQAEAMLRELGYGGKYKPAEMGAGVTKHTSTFRRAAGAEGRTVNPYLSAGGDRMIEPHTSLEESWFGLKVDITPGIRERAETACAELAEVAGLGQYPCRVLNREDLLLHIGLHFCFHLIQGAPALVQLTDLLVITQAGNLDWETFTARVQSYDAVPYAFAGLKLARDLLGAPVPAAQLTQLADLTPPALRQRIQMLGLADILRRTQQKPLTSITQRLQRGFQDRAATAAWAADWHGRIQVWRTLFQPVRTDTGQMLLQKLRTTDLNDETDIHG
ncbi:MAG: nucleotidyltransferase family protein [Chloroflexi bacterium]|nr:nucleotidyltransferase family protein [Chloroflexota bacterium]